MAGLLTELRAARNGESALEPKRIRGAPQPRGPNRRQSARSSRQGNPNCDRGSRSAVDAGASRHICLRPNAESAIRPRCVSVETAKGKSGRCWGGNGARSCPWPQGDANT